MCCAPRKTLVVPPGKSSPDTACPRHGELSLQVLTQLMCGEARYEEEVWTPWIAQKWPFTAGKLPGGSDSSANN